MARTQSAPGVIASANETSQNATMPISKVLPSHACIARDARDGGRDGEGAAHPSPLPGGLGLEAAFMDATDRKVLAKLQKDGRLTATGLAERVGLSPSLRHRRLRSLEGAGVIAGTRAVIDPAKVGLGFSALPGVLRLTSTLAMKAVLKDRPLPL